MVGASAFASSHREAPRITETPKVDATDFYMFNSYEAGREGYVTFIANYVPLQDAYGGPNYFTMDGDAVYDINISTDGGATPDITLRFDFTNTFANTALNIGGEMVPVPLLAIGGVTAGDSSNLLIDQTYTLDYIENGGASTRLNITGGTDTILTKPQDNVGNKTFPDYAAYANQYIYEIDVPGTELTGRVFVGQRQDPFVVNLGEIFDLVNLNPVGPPDARQNDLADKNVTSIVIELPVEAVTNGTESVIGAWTTASLPDVTGELEQVSRLGHPLVNEVVIGVPDKDNFNASQPMNDGADFLTYVTNPTLPTLLEVLFGVTAPTSYPRTDLVSVFLTGITLPDGTRVTAPANVQASEMLRLNTNTTTFPVTPQAEQNTLGVIGGDTSGFPNGRRPGDDVVDIALRAAMGVLLPEADAPSGQLAYTDGAALSAMDFPAEFPYLNLPIPGSPNDPSINVTVQQSDDLMEFLAIGNGRYDDTSKLLTVPRTAANDKEFFRLKGEIDGVNLSVDRVGADSTVLKLTVEQ